MEYTAHISLRSEYPLWKVLIMRFIRYMQAAYLLHLMAVFSMAMVCYFGWEFLMLRGSGEGVWPFILNGFACIYFVTLIFFSQFDARSRFQNYKMLKDKFFEYGFDIRLLKPFMYSRCQRDAISVAARELEFNKEWKQLIHKSGFRWYHLIPTMLVQSPRLLFTRGYWIKTLFVKTYSSKYFLW